MGHTEDSFSKNEYVFNEVESYNLYVNSINELIPKLVIEINANPPNNRFFHWLKLDGKDVIAWRFDFRKDQMGNIYHCFLSSGGQLLEENDDSEVIRYKPLILRPIENIEDHHYGTVYYLHGLKRCLDSLYEDTIYQHAIRKAKANKHWWNPILNRILF